MPRDPQAPAQVWHQGFADLPGGGSSQRRPVIHGVVADVVAHGEHPQPLPQAVTSHRARNPVAAAGIVLIWSPKDRLATALREPRPWDSFLWFIRSTGKAYSWFTWDG